MPSNDVILIVAQLVAGTVACAEVGWMRHEQSHPISHDEGMLARRDVLTVPDYRSREPIVLPVPGNTAVHEILDHRSPPRRADGGGNHAAERR